MKTITLLLLGALLCSAPASAQMMLQKAVIASGGGVSSGFILKSNITVGQAVVGTASNATQKAQLGFWTTAIPQPTQGVGQGSELELSIQSWPNPARKDCKVTVTSPSSEIEIRLFDLAGKEVKFIYSGPTTAAAHSFSVADLPAGSYILAASAPGQLAERLISVVK